MSYGLFIRPIDYGQLREITFEMSLLFVTMKIIQSSLNFSLLEKKNQ